MFYQLSSFFLVVLPLLAFQLASSKISYWISNPSTYYMVKNIHDALDIMHFNDQLKKKVVIGSPVGNYLKMDNGKLSSTDLVLLTAMATSEVIREKKNSD